MLSPHYVGRMLPLSAAFLCEYKNIYIYIYSASLQYLLACCSDKGSRCNHGLVRDTEDACPAQRGRKGEQNLCMGRAKRLARPPPPSLFVRGLGGDTGLYRICVSIYKRQTKSACSAVREEGSLVACLERAKQTGVRSTRKGRSSSVSSLADEARRRTPAVFPDKSQQQWISDRTSIPQLMRENNLGMGRCSCTESIIGRQEPVQISSHFGNCKLRRERVKPRIRII